MSQIKPTYKGFEIDFDIYKAYNMKKKIHSLVSD